MQQNLVGLAFAAGLVAALNPCGFAMLPAYLALVVRGSGTRVSAAVGRAVAATVAMTLGFLVVFAAFGLLTVALASVVQQYIPYVTVVVGVVLVALGGWLLSGRALTVLMPDRLGTGVAAPTARLGSMFGYGVGYALASLSCTVGPFLAVTGAGLGTAGAGRLWVYLAYAAGFALVVGALAVSVAVAGSALADPLKRILPYVNRIGGATLILVGLYVAYYGYYEIRLFAGGDPADPVIAAAGRLQGAIAGWVHRQGSWPWLLLLAATFAAAVWLVRRAYVRRGQLNR
ncbi:cytochrome c biogenesis CcdA family protein [Mycobacterium sp. ITM-2016-00317]|uniref:cytochrome c biogenesis CcdA family protein n=1 Tax=Mycobacterium sp. ITM-2016-00317 TaxID=2099694 RepID=UPI000D47A2F1|nr:cytochrome c biogenesis CcdA family protein [Mycobacterium sp. ITM-2016-00317]WNG88155.1 cytochrome c biogenesis CcdA family protein [Mycobacterium sp. ITM-2016-00317]